ncbi:restriction endonuclease subunit S [Pseudoalteromonas sp. C2R02]|uniref:restriction endonuclease subunit S n=1 Tax=Pseudoalteromonas sp. C2R02 TaxID=2841565 RepID=UPI001C093A76|nr:restriction endonuclease subunit S [Pseudoalteromonas sp. C2R02]MBU2969224.1 restriction endonuclease subunit S [Pseudoalteromonas sp. C2R02]
MVPSSWSENKLSELCEKIAVGLAISVTPYMRSAGTKLIRNQNIKRNFFNTKSVVYIDHEFAEKNKSKKVYSGDVVAVRTGSNIGEACVVPKEFDGALTFTTLIARPIPAKLSSEFLGLHINSERGISEVNRLSAGGGKPNLNSGELKNYKLLTPPIGEQHKIAKILSTWDKAICATERLVDNSKEQKKSLMQQLLTGRKRLLDDSNKPFEGEWEIKHVSEIATIRKGKALSSKNLELGDYPVIAGGKTSPYKHSQYTNEKVITISASGAYAGFVAYHENKIWASDCSVVKENECTDIQFIYQYLLLNQQKIYSFQSGGAQPHIYPKDIDALKLRVPNITEQQKIASVLTNADKEIKLLEQQLGDLKQEKKALMQQLLTGKRRVKI